jgi:prophage tail gpP-like protein
MAFKEEKPQEDVFLKIDGSYFYGWKDVRVYKSMNNGSGGFSLSTSDRYPDAPEDWKLKIGSRCTIEIEGQTVLTGYIDDINTSYDYQNHTIDVIGRDNTCDLVDCNYPREKTWKAQTLKKMVSDVCSTFGIELAIDKNDPKIASICNEKFPADNITIQCSDTAYDFIVKLCQMKALLPICYGDGKLTIARAGSNGKALVPIQLGYNILTGKAEYSNKDRFSHYMVKGQSSGKAMINTIKDITAPSNTAKYLLSRDKDIKRYRPKVLTHDGNADDKSCKNFADWTRNSVAGNSRKFSYNLVEWIQGPSDKTGTRTIWQLNQLVQVDDPTLGIKSTLLINSIEFRCSDSEGTITTLGLVDPNTYTPVPFTSNFKESKGQFNSTNDLKNLKVSMDLPDTQEDYTEPMEDLL